MKYLLFFLLAMPAMAEIENSNFTPRHQAMIEAAVEAKCGFRSYGMAEVYTKATAHRVDQGIVDYKYETLLEVKSKIDQMQYDIYEVVVHSSYYSQYDHNAKDWGAYEIDSVSNCRFK